jgi:hypothetical protein
MGHERKYGEITTERGYIPPEEPVFLLRAQDICAVPAMQKYLDECIDQGSPEYHINGVGEAIQRFLDWETSHGAKVPTSSAQG